MTINVYAKGALVRLAAVFTDEDDTEIDPTAVQLEYRFGSGAVQTLVYGSDPDLVKDSTGNYHADISADSVGKYFWRWSSTGTGQAAEEGEFMVSQSAFD